MSDKHLYLSLIPQALIASMLEPKDFGSYYAVGTQVHVQGESIFFEVDPEFRSPDFPFHLADERCMPKANGQPKNSVYLGIYHVLSRIPISALGNLYLVTNDGKTLTLTRGEYQPRVEPKLHLYQEFCPINPMVASRLEPRDFATSITDSTHPVHVPRIVFSELRLGDLAHDPKNGSVDDIPYSNITHLRDILQELQVREDKASKLVLKQVKEGVLYRMVEGGFYVGDQDDFAFYPYPSLADLEDQYRSWWRSAQLSALD